MIQKINKIIFLEKLNEVKIGNETIEQRETISNLETFYKSREEIINFFRDFIEMLSDAKEQGLNINT